jgi:hypothetical protein
MSLIEVVANTCHAKYLEHYSTIVDMIDLDFDGGRL